MACRRSFELGLLALCALSWVSCRSVRPQDKELLSDPAMQFGGGGVAAVHEGHVLDNREGATGAGQAVGGGCGCN